MSEMDVERTVGDLREVRGIAGLLCVHCERGDCLTEDPCPERQALRQRRRLTAPLTAPPSAGEGREVVLLTDDFVRMVKRDLGREAYRPELNHFDPCPPEMEAITDLADEVLRLRVALSAAEARGYARGLREARDKMQWAIEELENGRTPFGGDTLRRFVYGALEHFEARLKEAER